MGFAKRVFPKREFNVKNNNMSFPNEEKQSETQMLSTTKTIDEEASKEKQDTDTVSSIRTEITFDFHRLNVLVLRAVMRDNFLVGRKVGTFTMSEAKIHATLGAAITVEGSLGGLQVIDLTPEGISHQRILSVGKDPLTEQISVPAQDLLSSLTQEIYGNPNKLNYATEDQQALSFYVSRDLNSSVTIRIRMASVWYTHCARFMQELNWCATEFKHYLK